MTTLNIADYKTENWSVSRSITDALWTLTAQIDKHATPAFFTKIKAVAKDHGGNDKTPFVGIFPGSDYIMAPVGDKATLTGYDYAWYLTTQYVPAFGSGTAWHTTLIGTDPAETVRTLLGGDANWATVTGVKPFRMTADADWGTRQKVFEFDEKCTRWQAIQEIAEYCNYVFVVKPYYDSGDWYSYAYFIPEANIDLASPNGLDLPAMQTFTKPDAYLLPGTTIRDNPEKGFNRVKVTGYDETTQTYYYHTSESAGVGATPPTELAIEYFYASKDLNTQLKVDTRADELLAYFQASSKVYTAKLKQRLDLELYQKVRFADYDKIEGTTGVPVDMRITRISYHHAAVDDYVEIEFAKDQDAQQLQRLTAAVNPDYVSGTLDIVDDDLYATGLIDPLGYRYLRTDKHAVGDQNLYTDLDVRDDHAIEFYESGSGNLWGFIRAFDGASWAGLNIESSATQDLNIRAAADLELYANQIMRFEDAEVTPSVTLLQLAKYIVGKAVTTNFTNEYVLVYKTASGKFEMELKAGGGVTDHGALTGLADDDHTQYLLASGSRALTGTWSVGGNKLTGLGSVNPNNDLTGITFASTLDNPLLAVAIDGDSFNAYANGDMGGHKIASLAAGTVNGDAVRFDQLASYLPLSAGSGKALTGDLHMGGNKIRNAYIIKSHDSFGIQIRDNGGLGKISMAVSGYSFYALANGSMGGHKITGLAAGTVNGDAVRYEQLGTGVSKISNCTDTVKVDCKADCNIDITVPSGKVVTFIRS